MRNAPFRLAVVFLLITIERVALFTSLGLKVGWTGWVFGLGLPLGVYVSAFFLRYKETRWPGITMTGFFMLFDLWFNEGELIRSLSSADLVPPDSNFLGMGAAELTNLMQISALAFGAFPTIAAAGLGWLQSGAERVAVLRTRSWFGKFGLAIGARVSSWFPETEEKRQVEGRVLVEMPDGSGNRQISAGKVRWDTLSAGQKVEIAALPDAQIIALYGGSRRRARMWRQWAKEGK